VAFAVGIAIGARTSLHPDIVGASAGALAVLAAALSRRTPAWLALVIGAVAAGGGFIYARGEQVRERHLGAMGTGATTLIGLAAADASPWAEDRISFPLQVEERRLANRTVPARSLIWVSASTDATIRAGDRVEVVAEVRRPTPPSSPGAEGLDLRRAAKGYEAIARVQDPALLRVLQRNAGGPLQRRLNRARDRVAHVLRASFPRSHGATLASLLGSILFGVTSFAPPQWLTEVFRRTGLTHIIVVSGTQISLLFGIVFLPAVVIARRRGSRLPARPGPAILAAVTALIVAYALFAGGGAPIVRAVIAGIVIVAALAMRNIPRIADEHPLEPDRFTLLALAALVLLVKEPRALFDPGLQLSFAAVAGILALGPALYGCLWFLPGWLAVTIAASVAAQVATCPILVWHFGHVPIIGFVANLFVIPVAAVLLVTGLAQVALGLIWLPLAYPLGWFNSLFLWMMVRTASIAAAVPGGYWPVASPSLGWIVIYYVLALAIVVPLGAWGRAKREARDAGPAIVA
jgi:competence protein ComEC